ncbi:hypothetical protein [Vibrio phage vB_VmeM-Yong XC32]|nr:hypothetical protein [Vibrio phage vB_VmeM-Yong XC31]QAX96360.1 hypothetical protein [Vibrio phage vB_VmeM-Yong XC32]QAX96678.1 hypothetical protein [Vibrio phage vB_VmeM-Yong MS31]QAX96996.1 hypothetical protein [Vibrio phage vB_VmeM-Yong MS32]
MAEYKKTPLDHNKLVLRGEPYTADDWKGPTLKFDIYAGNPQFVVWSEHPAEEGKVNKVTGKPLHKTPIKASTSYPRLRSIFYDLLSLVGKHEPTTRILETLTVLKDEDGNTVPGKRAKQARIVYGRNPEGYLFIEIRNKERPVLPFLFKDDSWHNVVNDDETTTHIAHQSDLIARGFLDSVLDVYSKVFYHDYDPDFKPKGRNGGNKDKYASKPQSESEVSGSSTGW